tara:strand:+ start:123 stop:440 length:318 start_codon:yes stop_codon:yes gene_type:complete
MKLTKQQLKQIIKEELEKIFEDKSEHIAGISAKIDRLQKAVESAQKGMSNMEAGALDDMDLMDIRTLPAYWAKQQEVMNLNDKITLLLKQLQQLKQDEPGELARP